MRTTLNIDDDVLDKARQIADAEGRSVGAVISALARTSLAAATITQRSAFPLFDVAADAPRITAEDVSRASDGE